ncbi:hypothetical protein J5690_01630 [bacterium]|nr:hypothetical protein [bacterium]
MGMPEMPQNGMNIAPDGTIYEILEDGTIKRIGKVSPDGSFEPFGGAKDRIIVKDGIIYRVVNGEEQRIGRLLPDGEDIEQKKGKSGCFGCIGCFGKVMLFFFILLLIAIVCFAGFIGYISIVEGKDVGVVLEQLWRGL